MKKEITIGQKISGYQIIGITSDYCIAVNELAPEPYVIWKLDADKCGVYAGRYCDTKEEAVGIWACVLGNYPDKLPEIE